MSEVNWKLQQAMPMCLSRTRGLSKWRIGSARLSWGPSNDSCWGLWRTPASDTTLVPLTMVGSFRKQHLQPWADGRPSLLLKFMANRGRAPINEGARQGAMPEQVRKLASAAELSSACCVTSYQAWGLEPLTSPNPSPSRLLRLLPRMQEKAPNASMNGEPERWIEHYVCHNDGTASVCKCLLTLGDRGRKVRTVALAIWTLHAWIEKRTERWLHFAGWPQYKERTT